MGKNQDKHCSAMIKFAGQTEVYPYLASCSDLHFRFHVHNLILYYTTHDVTLYPICLGRNELC